ncbi:MAG: hypothetical protein GX760_04755 [Erysipelothrix sp.]|nr:hypothetical protein [Erysipelothrix sp.]
MRKYAEALGLPHFVVLTKADKLSRQQQIKQKALIAQMMELPEDAFIVHSSEETQDERSTEEVWKMIDQMVEIDTSFEEDEA